VRGSTRVSGREKSPARLVLVVVWLNGPATRAVGRYSTWSRDRPLRGFVTDGHEHGGHREVRINAASRCAAGSLSRRW